jgi:hypothetical protein
MSILSNGIIKRNSILLFVLVLFSENRMAAQNQKISFGVFAEPVISWFSTDTKDTRSSGARAGFCFGFNFNKYFTNNYAFSTGLNISSAGGRIYNTSQIEMEFNNSSEIIPANEKVTYKVQYLCLPLGLKFKSNQIGYLTFFSDIGIDPKVVIGGKVDIASPDIKDESAMNEINKFNLAYHIMPGIEYSLGGTTAIVIGVGYEKNFLDVTKDLTGQPYNQPKDKITHNIIKFRFGINF